MHDLTEFDIKKIDVAINAAIECTKSNDYNKKLTLYALAIDYFNPYKGEEYGLPRMALNMGVLTYHIILSTESFINDLTDIKVVKEFKENYIMQLTKEAANFFEMAADMRDYEGDFAPARAKDCLARLYEEKRINNGNNLETAFQLRLEAAETGFVEAQINLAVMYYLGQGTEVNYQETKKWLSFAEDQLSGKGDYRSEITLAEIREMIETVNYSIDTGKPKTFKNKSENPFELRLTDQKLMLS